MSRAVQRKAGPVTTRFQHTTDVHASRKNGPSASAQTKRGVRTFAPTSAGKGQAVNSPGGRSPVSSQQSRGVRTVGNTIKL